MVKRTSGVLAWAGRLLGCLAVWAALIPLHRHAGTADCPWCTLTSLGRRDDLSPVAAGLVARGSASGDDPSLRLAAVARPSLKAVQPRVVCAPVLTPLEAPAAFPVVVLGADAWGRRAPPGRAPPLS